MEWTKLREGWYKLNFDGALKGIPGPLGVGYVARDWEGNILAIGASKLSEGINNEVDAWATIQALKIAKKLGLLKIQVECDFLIIINTIKKRWNSCVETI